MFYSCGTLLWDTHNLIITGKWKFIKQKPTLCCPNILHIWIQNNINMLFSNVGENVIVYYLRNKWKCRLPKSIRNFTFLYVDNEVTKINEENDMYICIIKNLIPRNQLGVVARMLSKCWVARGLELFEFETSLGNILTPSLPPTHTPIKGRI